MATIHELPSNLEDIGRYRPGGYHPVEIETTATHRTWDLGPAPRSRHVAVKILVADAQGAEGEHSILCRLQPQPPTQGWIASWLLSRVTGTETKTQMMSGREFVVSLLDEFEIRGPNGSHRCIITEVLGPTAAAVEECPELNADPLPLDIARRVIAQCAKGLAFLHSHGVVHGDLHSKNIAFTIPDIDSWPVDEVYAAFGEPLKVPLRLLHRSDSDADDSEDEQLQSQPTTRSCHQPRYLVAPASVSNLWAVCTSTSRPGFPSIRLLDFTESFHTLLPPGHPLPGMPHCIAPPELLLSFSSEIAASIDIWAFACITYELLGEDHLFTVIFGTADEVLADMVVVLGGKDKFPERSWNEFWGRKGGRKWFDKEGAVVSKRLGRAVSWEDRVKGVRGNEKGGLAEEDEAILRGVLMGGLIFEPTEGVTVEEIVQMIPEEWGRTIV